MVGRPDSGGPGINLMDGERRIYIGSTEAATSVVSLVTLIQTPVVIWPPIPWPGVKGDDAV